MNVLVANFLSDFTRWASREHRIHAVALVGSHARGAARADSDVDLVTLALEREYYFDDVSWTGIFGTVLTTATEHYGAVESLRVHYEQGLEVEFGFARPEWADTTAADPGTLEVVSDGMTILLDKAGGLAAISAVGVPSVPLVFTPF